MVAKSSRHFCNFFFTCSRKNSGTSSIRIETAVFPAGSRSFAPAQNEPVVSPILIHEKLSPSGNHVKIKAYNSCVVNVSQESKVPFSKPMVNQRRRNREDPWVNESGISSPFSFSLK